MKKIIFVLAIFIAAPAFAVDVSLVDNGDDTVSIMYSGADANAQSTMPRAFALEITIDTPGSITDVLNYKNDIAHDNNGVDETGESNSVYPGYGIYPAQITWLPPSGGDPRDVNDWGSPLANQSDPGCGDTIPGASTVVLEFGSLYYGDVNEPRAEGKLCDLLVSCGGATANLNIVMVDEDEFRGGLVFEDGSLGVVNTSEIHICGDCWTGDAASRIVFESVGSPPCWCASNQPRQCHGDADNLPEGKGNYWASLNDLAVLKAAWNKPYGTIAGQTGGSVPTPLICADFDRTPEGKGNYRVSLLDLGILKDNWNQGNLPAADCADVIGSQEP